MCLKRQKPGDLPQMRETWQLCFYTVNNLTSNTVVHVAKYNVIQDSSDTNISRYITFASKKRTSIAIYSITNFRPLQ